MLRECTKYFFQRGKQSMAYTVNTVGKRRFCVVFKVPIPSTQHIIFAKSAPFIWGPNVNRITGSHYCHGDCLFLLCSVAFQKLADMAISHGRRHNMLIYVPPCTELVTKCIFLIMTLWQVPHNVLLKNPYMRVKLYHLHILLHTSEAASPMYSLVNM